MKQFIGSWKCELGKDTILVGDNIPFGTGLVCNSQILVKGKMINSVRQLFGYDKKIDKFIVGKNGHIDHPLPVLKDHPSPGGKTTP